MPRGSKNPRKTQEGEGSAEVPVEVEAPVAFFLEDPLAPTIDFNVPPSISRSILPPSTSQDVESSYETCASTPATPVFSPTLSLSTISDLTPTELGEEIAHSEEQATVRHDTFYFEDGNVEIVCGGIVFRVHSTIISFTSSKLQNILSPPALLHAPMPEGLPRITVSDGAEDFAVLLKVIYTPG